MNHTYTIACLTKTVHAQCGLPLLYKTAPVLVVYQEVEEIRQKNEGRWEFTLHESQDGACIELDVEIGRYMDTSLVKADVQPSFVRLLIKVDQQSSSMYTVLQQPSRDTKCAICSFGCHELMISYL